MDIYFYIVIGVCSSLWFFFLTLFISNSDALFGKMLISMNCFYLYLFLEKGSNIRNFANLEGIHNILCRFFFFTLLLQCLQIIFQKVNFELSKSGAEGSTCLLSANVSRYSLHSSFLKYRIIAILLLWYEKNVALNLDIYKPTSDYILMLFI